MTTNRKNVLVTGDVIMHHHIYAGDGPTPGSGGPLGTLTSQTPGGAALSFQLIQAVGERAPDAHAFTTKFSLEESSNLPPHLNGYAVWKPYPAGEGRKGRVWRVAERFGYGGPVERAPEPVLRPSDAADSSPSIVVIDDAALGFRFRTAEEAWPTCIANNDQPAPEWIVLMMSSPVGRGELWRRLIKHHQERLVVLISIDDIRREEVKVSKGISWERTALDLVRELHFNAAIRGLLQCKHLIVSFHSAGALLVMNAASKERSCRLLFDAERMEREWTESIPGDVFGYMSCLTAAVVSRLVHSEPRVEEGAKAGLSAMRQLLRTGHGNAGETQPGLEPSTLASEIVEPQAVYAAADVPTPSDSAAFEDPLWNFVAAGGKRGRTKDTPLHGVARRVALFGPVALRDVPYARFGLLFTVNRQEIESLRNLGTLIRDYENTNRGEKPLSLAVFGPPGSGKSFSIKQVARAILGRGVPVLEFNLSQFADPKDLIGAFHQVRDKVLAGTTPFVFWDEFDSREYEWLQYFLAPMQDGSFQEGQLTHPIGKCVFVFAGGTSPDKENFGSKEGEEGYRDFQLRKGPDFISRLHGYLNVLGPNRKKRLESNGKWVEDPTDVGFPLRRALLIRVAVGLFGNERLAIDRGMLSALLEVNEYRHGARSLVRIVSQLQNRMERGRITRSDLPADSILSMDVSLTKFNDILNRDLDFQLNAGALAEAIHNFYRSSGSKTAGEVAHSEAFSELSTELQEDNRAAALRIPEVIALAGLYLARRTGSGADDTDEIRGVLEDYIEILAEEEHKRWMEHKKQDGWVKGETRKDEEIIHDALVPYEQLSAKMKARTRDSVRRYPDLLEKTEFTIVTSWPEEPREQ